MSIRPVQTAMVMAAGLGTRMRPFTDEVAKAVLPVLGVPLAQYVVDALSAAGVRKFVANIHHGPKNTRAGLQKLEQIGSDFVISDESSLLMGSAGGLKKAEPHFREGPFFYANADVLSDIDWSALAVTHHKLREQQGVILTMTLSPGLTNGEKYRQVLYDEKTNLVTGLGGPVQGKPFFASAAVLDRETLAGLPQGPSDFIKDILEPAIQRKQVGVYIHRGIWFDIGTPAQWLNTHVEMMNLLEKGTLPGPAGALWRKRIEALNRRIGKTIWVSKDSPRTLSTKDWVGPCYWSSEGKVPGPSPFGPRAILYGSPPRHTPRNGIGSQGKWVDIDKPS